MQAVWYQVEVKSENRWVPMFGKFDTAEKAFEFERHYGGRVVKVTQTTEVIQKEGKDENLSTAFGKLPHP